MAEVLQNSAKASSSGRRALRDLWSSEAAVYRITGATDTVAEIESALTTLAKDQKLKPGQVRGELDQLAAKLLAATQELRGAQQQARDGLFAVENAYVDLYGSTPELARGAEAYDGACAEGDAQSCIRRGQLLQSGDFVAKDLAAAANQFARACVLGSGYACLRQGSLLLQSGDAPAARPALDRGCELGEPRACRGLARDLEVGRGGPIDATRAAELNQRACMSDVPEACVALALQRLDGKGVTRNADQAKTLLELACDGGDIFGCTQLAVLLSRGVGVPVDRARATQLFDKACKGGDANACDANVRSEVP
ncbi:MAG: sel1 repeat family protein [Clostridia bacterium]|nr:sel1 repeat family protein [Deltaproteobacteria bacterium]